MGAQKVQHENRCLDLAAGTPVDDSLPRLSWSTPEIGTGLSAFPAGYPSGAGRQKVQEKNLRLALLPGLPGTTLPPALVDHSGNRDWAFRLPCRMSPRHGRAKGKGRKPPSWLCCGIFGALLPSPVLSSYLKNRGARLSAFTSQGTPRQCATVAAI